jgi:hypothetical protein
MLKRIRAIAVVAGLWAGAWAVTGAALNACRFVFHAGDLGLQLSLTNVLPWVLAGIRVGGPCGLVAGATFGIMLLLVPPLKGVRISKWWATAYGISSGLAASFYILRIGYGDVMLPVFASMFAVIGVITAIAISAVADGGRMRNAGAHASV